MKSDKTGFLLVACVCFIVAAILFVWMLAEDGTIKINKAKSNRVSAAQGPILTEETIEGLIELGREIERYERGKRIIIDPFKLNPELERSL